MLRILPSAREDLREHRWSPGSFHQLEPHQSDLAVVDNCTDLSPSVTMPV